MSGSEISCQVIPFTWSSTLTRVRFSASRAVRTPSRNSITARMISFSPSRSDTALLRQAAPTKSKAGKTIAEAIRRTCQRLVVRIAERVLPSKGGFRAAAVPEEPLHIPRLLSDYPWPAKAASLPYRLALIWINAIFVQIANARLGFHIDPNPFAYSPGVREPISSTVASILLRFRRQWPLVSPALKPAQSPARSTSLPASVTSTISPDST